MTTTIVLQAAAAGSDFSKLRLVIDGEIVGAARIDGGTSAALSFEIATLDPDIDHEIAVQHYHDTGARALTIEALSIDGLSVDLANAYEDIGPRDDRVIERGPAARTIEWNGTFIVDLPVGSLTQAGHPAPEPVPDPPAVPVPEPEPLPAPEPLPPGDDGSAVITVTAQAATGDFSKFRLLVDGEVRGSGKIAAGKAEAISFEIGGLSNAPHTIGVQHYHDTAGRALTVEAITVNGVPLDPADWRQDVGPLDGKTIWTGPSAQTVPFNGTVLADAPAALFGDATTPPDPDPVPDPDPAPDPDPSPSEPEPPAPSPEPVDLPDPAARWAFAEEGGSRSFDGSDDVLIVGPSQDGDLDLMILGDSITVAGSKRIAEKDSFPTVLDDALQARGLEVDVLAYSKSGDTTEKGLARLQDWFDDGNTVPDAAIVALGTNDSRWAKPLAEVEQNLVDILDIFDGHDTEVLLVGTYGSWPLTNQGYGSAATAESFEAIYPRLADAHDALLYPHLLDGILDEPERWTSDNLHPNAAGTERLVDFMLPSIETLIGRVETEPADGGGLLDDLALDTGTVVVSFEADATGGRQGLFSKDASGYGDGGHLTLFLDGDRLAVRLQDDDSSHYLRSASGSIEADTAHTAAFGFGDEGMRLWLDGELVGSSDYSGGIAQNDEPLVIGALGWSSAAGQTNKTKGYFDGTISDVAVYDVALKQDEIEALVLSG